MSNSGQVKVYGNWVTRLGVLAAVAIGLRLVFFVATGADPYRFSNDWMEYDLLSNRVCSGDFNMDVGRFVTSPLYPVFLALLKILIGSYWAIGASILQIVATGLLSLWVYRISFSLFDNAPAAWLAGYTYALYVPLYYYSQGIGGEALYLVLLVASINYLLKYRHSPVWKNLLWAALFFSLCFLTKSYILFFLPVYLLGVYYYTPGAFINKCNKAASAGLLGLLLPVVFGCYNLARHEAFILSSNGYGFHLANANSNLGYIDAFEMKRLSSRDSLEVMRMNLAFFDGDSLSAISQLPVKDRPGRYANYSWQWIKQNTSRFWALKGYNLKRFVLPGISGDRHSFAKYVLMFVTGAVIYFAAYYSIIVHLRRSWEMHFWMLGLIGAIGVFLIVFLYTSRYKNYTLDLFYIIYAAPVWLSIVNYLTRRRINPIK